MLCCDLNDKPQLLLLLLCKRLCLELVLVCLAQHLLLKHFAHNGKAQLHGTAAAAAAQTAGKHSSY
jgi:hypothetical protein